jgi:hypothetical protein
MGSRPALKMTKKGALDSQPQVIKFTSCLPMVICSPGTLAFSTTNSGRHDIADILLKVALNTKNQIKSSNRTRLLTTTALISYIGYLSGYLRPRP